VIVLSVFVALSEFEGGHLGPNRLLRDLKAQLPTKFPLSKMLSRSVMEIDLTKPKNPNVLVSSNLLHYLHCCDESFGFLGTGE